MKATGIVRRIDDLGRVVIPKELRRVLGIEAGDPLEIFTDGNYVSFRKYAPGCSLCGLSGRKLVKLYPEKLVCTGCVDLITREQDKLHSSALPAEEYGF
ncbi:AbrB/MazE/SpoVT family DNA-binding domain-containing protein [Paenibacillus polymyxa]|uniref:AbrB/MazE/SpoVT family DNA-binding domain-containing protein n=1 Tax=Paenibacillus polymyxa TaxID=1406 RepID=UPI000402F64C|nr:AbrB/MazE/SpoVT family DNA-binding domain-containing protein [Paenibacillus polymyxa]